MILIYQIKIRYYYYLNNLSEISSVSIAWDPLAFSICFFP